MKKTLQSSPSIGSRIEPTTKTAKACNNFSPARNLNSRWSRELKTLTDKIGGVDRIPTLFVFDPNGRETFSFLHLQGAEKMHVKSDELIGVLYALQ